MISDHPPNTSLSRTIAIFRKWLYLPDIVPLLAVIGTIAANRERGNPVWLMLIGGPGVGKSELLSSLTQLEDVQTISTLNTASLLSGTPRKESAGGSGGLLRCIGDMGTLVAKDFGSVLSMPAESRTATLGALREVYDGYWKRHLGVDGGKTLEWEGQVGFLGAATSSIEKQYDAMAKLGDRSIFVRLGGTARLEQARRAIQNASFQGDMRKDLSSAMAGLFANARLNEVPSPNKEDELLILAHLAAAARSGVDRDRSGKNISLIHETESPARIAVQLRRLYQGLWSMGADEANCNRVVRRVAIDTVPLVKGLIVEALSTLDRASSIRDLCGMTRYPGSTVRKKIEDLEKHRVVAKVASEGREHAYDLVEDIKEALRTFSPKSEQGAA